MADIHSARIWRHGVWKMSFTACLLLALVAFIGVGCPSSTIEELNGVVALGPLPNGAKMVDVGGYELACRDSGSGGPTVILINGLEENIKMWGSVETELAEITRVINYDRGGVGWSDEGSNPRTGTVIVRELHNLLDALDAPGPYILCAHSLGGLYARIFAHMYPNDVVGIVLVDTTHEDYYNRVALELEPKTVQSVENKMGLAVTVAAREGSRGEYYNIENTSSEVRFNRMLPEVPLIILGHDTGKSQNVGSTEQENIWDLLSRQFYQEQAKLTPRGKWQIVSGAGHLIQLDKPDAVVDAVKLVIQGW